MRRGVDNRRRLNKSTLHQTVFGQSALPHFRSDITDFIKFLPQSIPLMKNLPVDLLEYFLQSVFIGTGRSSGNSFVQTIILFIGLNKMRLTESPE
jgi:hypothetical protein